MYFVSNKQTSLHTCTLVNQSITKNMGFFDSFCFICRQIKDIQSVKKQHCYIPCSFLFTASELQSMQVECNGLHKECSVLRSEKQDIVNKHQKEKSSLQSECASFRAENEELLKAHQKDKSNLQSECAALRTEKEAALQKQQQLEKDLARSVHWSTLLGALTPTFVLPLSHLF